MSCYEGNCDTNYDTRNTRRPIYARSTYMDMEEIQRERMRSDWNPYEKEEEAYFRQMEYSNNTAGRQKTDRDLRNLQSMYPQSAKLLLPYVEEACNKLEYEGSFMYDEMPDLTHISRMQDDIWEQVSDAYRTKRTQGDASEHSGDDLRNERTQKDLIRVMLLDTMYHRRKNLLK